MDKNAERPTCSLAQAGCGSSDTVYVTSSFALVRAFAIPRLSPSCRYVGRNRRSVMDNEVKN